MPATPRVSVVMTLYNKGAYVEEAVQSILGQTYTDLELLVVDDVSTDDGLVKMKALTDPRIRILEGERNGGRAAAANRGVEASRGEYIAFLDADDIMFPERLAKQVAYLDAHPEVTILGTCVEQLREVNTRKCWPSTHAEALGGLIFTDAYMHPSSMVRRRFFVESGLRFDPDWRVPGMDYLFQVAVCSHVVFANLPEVLSVYRRGENNFRSGRDARADRLVIVTRVFELLRYDVSAEEVSAHVSLTGFLPATMSVEDVNRLNRWRERLLELNSVHRTFPQAHFEKEVMGRWHALYHRVADMGLWPGLAFWWSSPGRKWSWLPYLAKVRLRSLKYRDRS